MALDRLVSMALRAAELVFAAIVAGVTGEYLHRSHASSWDLGRFIYTEVVAALSILFALLWLIPFSGTFIHWPMDIFMSILWWVSFGLLVDVSISLLPLGLSQLKNAPANCGLLVDWYWLRWHLRLGQRRSTWRPVRQVQGRHRLRLSVSPTVACLCSRRLLLGP